MSPNFEVLQEASSGLGRPPACFGIAAKGSSAGFSGNTMFAKSSCMCRKYFTDVGIVRAQTVLSLNDKLSF